VAYSQHVSELRKIVLRTFYLFAVVYFITVYFFPQIYSFILRATGAPKNSVYVFGVSDIIGFYFTAPAVIAFLLVLPFALLMFYSWAQDALLPEERRFIGTYAKISAILFLIGVLISFPIVPRLLWLASFFANALHVKIIFSAREVFNIWLSMAVALGIVFQFPIVLSFLLRVGLVSKDQLRSFRRLAYPLFYIVAAVITPGDLLVTDLILFVVFTVLYEASILLTPTQNDNA